MKEIVTASQMKELDRQTISEMGVPSCVLMERAALAVTEEIRKTADKRDRILVVCGNGNNAGDGIAIARLLFLVGCDAEIFPVGQIEKLTEEAARQWKIAEAYHVPFVYNPDWDEYTIIVDAIFGVGLSRPIEGRYADIIGQMNRAAAKKVAVDIPSGIHGDDGRIMGTAFHADLTVTFAYRKRGLCLYPGRAFAGRVVVADIGIYRTTGSPNAWQIEETDLAALPGRNPGGNKGTFGKVLVVAGCETMCGAAYFSAEAALRAGAGMVQIQTVECNRAPLQTLLPEAMISCEFTEEENKRLLGWCDVLVIGPGLGNSTLSIRRAEWFLNGAHEAGKPVVLDADGLNLLAVHQEWKQYLGPDVILTPHLGEMSRLCGQSIRKIQENPVQTAVDYASETGAVLVLKDACTITADRTGNVYLNSSGNDGMATAGSGDVLSGLLAGVLCMYLQEEARTETLQKAALGVYLHGFCGDVAARKMGRHSMTARDIIRALPEVLQRKEEGS